MNLSDNTADGSRLRRLLTGMDQRGASDLHLVAGYRPVYRIHGVLEPADDEQLTAEQTAAMIDLITPDTLRETVNASCDADFSLALDDLAPGLRFRVNVFRNQSRRSACLRLVPREIPSLDWLGFPADLADRIVHRRHGLVLFTGITGSGKTTSMAALVNILNQEGGYRIITIEEPIEYVFPRNAPTIISQREVGVDVPTFYQGLKYGLRQDPDVILVGEIRDRETAQMALSAAETGHLVLSTLHTRDAKGAVTRFVDLFPHDAQDDVRSQLSLSLRFVVTQHLLAAVQPGDKRVLALEVLVNNHAVASAIRFGKIEALETAIQTGRRDGMVTLDENLRRLVTEGRITANVARPYSKDPDGSFPAAFESRQPCRKCGYLLIGLPEPRCPECGTPFTP